jgi:hypothetical protein
LGAAKGAHPVIHSNAAYWRFDGDFTSQEIGEYPQSNIGTLLIIWFMLI